MKVPSDIEYLESSLAKHNHLPPIDRWDPLSRGDMAMLIKRDGSWWHENHPLRRMRLVKLFSRVLRREADGDHYLVTPAEKFRIQVELAPFIIVGLNVVDTDDSPTLVLTTNLGEQTLLDRHCSLWWEYDQQTTYRKPFVSMRNGLKALISRPVYYELVDLAKPMAENEAHNPILHSAGRQFSLLDDEFR